MSVSQDHLVNTGTHGINLEKVLLVWLPRWINDMFYFIKYLFRFHFASIPSCILFSLLTWIIKIQIERFGLDFVAFDEVYKKIMHSNTSLSCSLPLSPSSSSSPLSMNVSDCAISRIFSIAFRCLFKCFSNCSFLWRSRSCFVHLLPQLLARYCFLFLLESSCVLSFFEPFFGHQELARLPPDPCPPILFKRFFESNTFYF